jgi:hypothetical protein
MASFSHQNKVVEQKIKTILERVRCLTFENNTPTFPLNRGVINTINYIINISLSRVNQNVTLNVATLAFGSRLRQGLAKVRAKREAQESHLMLPGV